MPQNCNEVRGAHRKTRAVYRVIEEQTPLLPLIKRGSSVSARDHSHVNALVIVGISGGKALNETSTREGSVGVYGAVHILPSAVAQDLESAALVVKRLCVIIESAACHIRLSYYQN
jgi:hypothetical protein